MTDAAHTRLFFGLEVTDEVAEGIARNARSTFGADEAGGAYGASDLHLTLVFLGARPAGDVARLKTLASAEFAGLHAPELVVRGDGGLSDATAGRSRAVWRAVGESSGTEGRLDALRNRAQQIGRMVGWRPGAGESTRPFRPHVTVARPSGRPEEGESLEEGLARLGRDRAWLVPEVALFESCSAAERSAGSGRYRILATWNLAVGPD